MIIRQALSLPDFLNIESMVQFNLITGFLGSGKTTLLSNLLKEFSGKKRVAVIQNEFAPSGVDGKELKQGNEDFELIEINNGSVFCVCQLNNFEETMDKLLTRYSPDIIFLEASGLADPISIVEILQLPSLAGRVSLDKSICLVDAGNFFKGLNGLVRFKHQIMVADLVILNKTDQYSGNIEDITQKIKELNPYTDIIPAVYAKINWTQISKSILETGYAAGQFQGQKSEGRPEIIACVLRVHDKTDLQGLRDFIDDLGKTCIRIKGFVNLIDGTTVLLQSVYGNLDVKSIAHYTGRTEIIAFGEGIDVAFLRNKFKRVVVK